jgi:hypothetical protein
VSAIAARPIPDAPLMRANPYLRLRQLLAVFRFSLRLHWREKRLIIVFLILLLPAVLPILYTIMTLFAKHEVPPFPPGIEVFKNLMSVAYLRVLLYIVALVYGLALVSDEVEGKTLIHYLLRPAPRWVMVVGKYAAAWIITSILLVLAVGITYGLLFAVQPLPVFRWYALNAENLALLGKDLAVLVFALGAYLALFSAAGAWLPRAERWGIVFTFGWESLITYLPARVKWFTLMFHVQTLFPHDVTILSVFTLRGEPLTKPTSAIILASVIVGGLALTVLNLKRREIR